MDFNLDDSRVVKRAIKFAPMVMSLLALGLVAEGVIEFGQNPPKDEGWQAHLFQILMVVQLPIILAFLITGWRSLKQNLPVVGTQVALWLLALGALRVSGF